MAVVTYNMIQFDLLPSKHSKAHFFLFLSSLPHTSDFCRHILLAVTGRDFLSSPLPPDPALPQFQCSNSNRLLRFGDSMSVSRRLSVSPPHSDVPSTHEFKHRVIVCLNKLGDRDTLSVATSELESIAKTLTNDLFPPFLACIHNTDATSKSPVRKQCVNLLSLLSNFHGDALTPFLSKMISTVVRRLRDQDSAVRSACVDASAAMSSKITKPPFSYFLNAFMETLTIEQDVNSQVGSALCLAAAVEAAPDPDAMQLRKCLPKLGKLAKSEGFKAKTALLVLIGSIVCVGGASSRSVLDWLMPCVLGFLGSEDWAVRKAAAETLGRVALAEKDLAAEYKSSCISSLESRRFDKIKVVRETFNQTLDIWREISNVSKVVSVASPYQSPERDNGSCNGGGCFLHVSKTCHDVSSKSAPKKYAPTNRLQPLATSLVTSAIKGRALKSNERNLKKHMTSELDHQKPADSNFDIAESTSPSSNVTLKEDIKTSGCRDLDFREGRGGGNSIPEEKSVLFNRPRDEKVNNLRGVRHGSRVVPFLDDEYLNSDVYDSSVSDEAFENQKDVEDISLIRHQLLHIENQQCNLLDILQRYIGSSQSGMNSLETRVRGLEMALDEISYDLAASNGRIPSSDFAENTCCKLPGTEFLSPKFWKRSEGRYSGSRFYSAACEQPPNFLHPMPDKDNELESNMSESRRFYSQSRSKLVVNPLIGVHGNSSENLRHYSIRMHRKSVQENDAVKGGSDSGTHEASPTIPKTEANFIRSPLRMH